jgi:hypothetical protein
MRLGAERPKPRNTPEWEMGGDPASIGRRWRPAAQPARYGRVCGPVLEQKGAQKLDSMPGSSAREALAEVDGARAGRMWQ